MARKRNLLKELSKFEEILNNLINGNLNLYGEQVRKLTKYNLIRFIYFAKEYGKNMNELFLLHYLDNLD
jgi:hypothetical protein